MVETLAVNELPRCPRCGSVSPRSVMPDGLSCANRFGCRRRERTRQAQAKNADKANELLEQGSLIVGELVDGGELGETIPSKDGEGTIVLGKKSDEWICSGCSEVKNSGRHGQVSLNYNYCIPCARAGKVPGKGPIDVRELPPKKREEIAELRRKGELEAAKRLVASEPSSGRLLKAYLILETVCLGIEDEWGSQPTIDKVRDALDFIWLELTDEEHEMLNKRPPTPLELPEKQPEKPGIPTLMDREKL